MNRTGPLTGTIECKECGQALAEARGVFEGEKAWHERMAMFNCRPYCEHAREKMERQHGMLFSDDIEVVWRETEQGDEQPIRQESV